MHILWIVEPVNVEIGMHLNLPCTSSRERSHPSSLNFSPAPNSVPSYQLAKCSCSQPPEPTNSLFLPLLLLPLSPASCYNPVTPSPPNTGPCTLPLLDNLGPCSPVPESCKYTHEIPFHAYTKLIHVRKKNWLQTKNFTKWTYELIKSTELQTRRRLMQYFNGSNIWH